MKEKKETIIKLIEKLTIKIKEGSISFNVTNDLTKIFHIHKLEGEENIDIDIEKINKKYILHLQLTENCKVYGTKDKDKLFYSFNRFNKNYKDIKCLFNLAIKKKLLAIEQKKKDFYEEIDKMIEEIGSKTE